ncbi:unnamed protein product [Cuscuta campestris]|uniref:F-box domain-containing protein n=1 Tax=Cuscuta campestris TaxID=132261 RepID=A0A484MHY2_9ASTE|nr:unnamed protein product [Cuscuta campestris]
MLQEEFSEKVEQCKVANCSNRLCDLPNELLLHILSFLEVKDAAQTSLSCKRWGQLWALVPDLHFKESDLSKRSLFLDFVERASALRGRLPMRAFSLNCEVEGAVVRVKKLIESVITSGVRDLSLVLSKYKRAYLLPSSIFTCASLEMLCVESFCLLKLPSICLPKLKVLILRNVMFEDNETLEKLFSTPSLERLDYEEGSHGSIKSSSCARPCIRVTGPKLQHLSLNMFKRSRSTIEINGTPLKSFHYRGWFVDTHCILEDTNQLIEAYLWSDDHIQDDNRDSCHAFKLLHLFSNVKELTLFSSLLLVESRRGIVPLFSNLIKLTLDWDFMISITGLWIMLRRSPRLQNLCFNKELHYQVNGSDDELLNPVPECFLTDLRTISVTLLCSERLHERLSMVREFLEKAMALTEMVIKVPQQYEGEGILLEKLSKYPMGSKNCRISLERMP